MQLEGIPEVGLNLVHRVPEDTTRTCRDKHSVKPADHHRRQENRRPHPARIVLMEVCIYISKKIVQNVHHENFRFSVITLIAWFMGRAWGPSGADRTQVGPMLAP